jgi:CMP-N-acetylneuraminic acid synthetase
MNSNNIIAIIPARSGSKSIKNKNLKKINGKSLLTLAIEISKKIKKINKIFVSTDSYKIANEAIKNNIEVPFLRSKINAKDSSSISKVLIEVIKKLKKKYKLNYNIVLLIEPTSPLRTIQNIEGAIKKFLKNNYNALWTISQTNKDYHPLKQLVIKKNNINFYETKGAQVYARQQLKNTFYRNGVCYLIKTAALLKYKNLMCPSTGYYLCNDINISIDTHEELEYAKKHFKKKFKL